MNVGMQIPPETPGFMKMNDDPDTSMRLGWPGDLDRNCK